MGELSIHDLTEFIEKYKCSQYVETGTGIGEALGHALKYNFSKYYTVDLDEKKILEAKEKFQDNRIEFNTGFSTECLKKILPRLNKDEPTLFFLDAHFPDSDFNGVSYKESISTHKENALPLVNELKIITENRDISKDCFIIDDWKLYHEDLPCQYSGWEYSNLQKELGLDVSASSVLNLIKNNHNYFVDLRHQGFLICKPSS